MLCAFQVVYNSAKKTDISPHKSSKIRKQLCLSLISKIRHDRDFDIVAPIPNTGRLYSKIIAEYLEIPHIEVFKKKQDHRTTGLKNNQRLSLNRKLFLLNSLNLKGKKVLIVDEAYATGQTAKIISQIALSNGAQSISFAFAAPPIVSVCPFDKVFRDYLYPYQLESEAERLEEIKAYLQAESVEFVSKNEFYKIFSDQKTCFKCFEDC